MVVFCFVVCGMCGLVTKPFYKGLQYETMRERENWAVVVALCHSESSEPNDITIMILQPYQT